MSYNLYHANDISLEKFDEGDDNEHDTETTYIHKKIVEFMSTGKQIIVQLFETEAIHI